MVLTPDLEEGGYRAQCEEMLAAIAQSDTEQEALNNIHDILEQLTASQTAQGG